MVIKERAVDVVNLALLGKVFEDRRPRLLHLVRQRLPRALSGRVTPEDVLSDVFLRAQTRWEEFQQRHSHLDETARPYDEWLAGLAEDAVIDAYRFHSAQKRDVRLDTAFPDGSGSQLLLGLVNPGTSPSRAFARAEQEQRLAQSLALLPEKDRELLRLRYIEGQPFAEVAAALGTSEAAVRVKHLRAVRRLKDVWKKLYGSEGLQS